MKNKNQKSALVTGAAGFIGFHTAKRLLDKGWRVVGFDCMSDYYDIKLKEEREKILLSSTSYRSIHEKVEFKKALMKVFEEEKPEIVIHLAAQAGVRHSIDNPRAYFDSNLLGTYKLLEAARAYKPRHMLLASTSSAYGANKAMPYKETVKADHQMSFYAATKKATENMAHSYSHLFDISITMFRFFTVYGPWGRPDMALFKFTEAILNDREIQVFNHGNMKRDFTYIDDLTEALNLLIEANPSSEKLNKQIPLNLDSLSPVAPFRIVNIGNSKLKTLTDFITALEDSLQKKAKKILMPMQPGDVPSTLADTRLLYSLTGFKPNTKITDGIQKFVNWYRNYNQI